MSVSPYTWESLGLPPPDPGATSYRIGVGLRRLRYPDGGVRQRRTYWHWPRTWTAQWTVSIDELQTMGVWIGGYGDSYNAMPLVSGEDAGGALVSHLVRVCSDVQIGTSGGRWVVRAELEQASGLTPADAAAWTWPPTLARFDGYSYGEDMGLLRTPFQASLARQTRLYASRPRLFAAHWLLAPAELAQAEAWLRAYGFRWFQARLLSPESGLHQASTHTVRVAADPVITYQPGGLYDLSLTLEQACANEYGMLLDEVAERLLLCIDGVRGYASAAASASGDLSTGVALAGAGQAVATGDGTLEGDLAGAATAQADAAADWDSRLAGDAAAQARASADLGPGAALEGAAPAEAGASGTLGSTGAALDGDAAAQADGEGTL